MNIIQSLGTTKSVTLPFDRQQIVTTLKSDNDLLIKLNNGEVIKVEGYFETPRHLILNPEQGKPIQLLEIDDVSGNILSSRVLSSAEVPELLGNDLAMLSSQTSEELVSNGVYESVASGTGAATSSGISSVLLGLGAVGATFGVVGAIKSQDRSHNNDTSKESSNQNNTAVVPEEAKKAEPKENIEKVDKTEKEPSEEVIEKQHIEKKEADVESVEKDTQEIKDPKVVDKAEEPSEEVVEKQHTEKKEADVENCEIDTQEIKDPKVVDKAEEPSEEVVEKQHTEKKEADVENCEIDTQEIKDPKVVDKAEEPSEEVV
ncbi:BapA/Bap/LapF family prefix-like domain-containing protein, partial [Phocoenobacter atlanticus]